MAYLIWKLIHIAAVVMFLGSITNSFLLAASASRSGDLQRIAITFEGIIRSDRYLMGPGVTGIIIGGFASAGIGSWPVLSTGWIFWSIVLFSVSGIVFGLRLAPLQRKIVALARSEDGSEGAWQACLKLSKQWLRWAALALSAAIAALVLMVLKPSLPAL